MESAQITLGMSPTYMYHILYTVQWSILKEILQKAQLDLGLTYREIITVRGQSYVSRLPKY
jgi:hypothetical protein